MPEDIRYEIEELTREAGLLLSIALTAGQVRTLEAPAIPAEFDEQLDAACAGLIGLAAPRLAVVQARLAELVALPQGDGGEQPVSGAQPAEGGLPPVEGGPNEAPPAEGTPPGSPDQQAPAPALEG